MAEESKSFIMRSKFSLILIGLQIFFLILFGAFVRYGDMGKPVKLNGSPVRGSSSHGVTHGTHMSNISVIVGDVTTKSGGQGAADKLAGDKVAHIPQNYAMFQDVHVMIFIGFGFLMTFLKRYGFSSVGFNFLLAAFILQWATLIHGFVIKGGFSPKMKIPVDIMTLVGADFTAAAVLISFGAVLGKVSMLQLIVMGLLEVIFFMINQMFVFEFIEATDIGDSLVVHVFGAYFGLAVTRVLYNPKVEQAGEKEGSVYQSDLFAMIGTVFLWLFWPSFNGIAAADEGRTRAVINTYFSLTASTVVTYAISHLLHKEKFNMVHVQNSTLAGGVAVGSLADLIIQPWGALFVGSVAGAVSVLGYRYVTPWMNSKLKIHDTCGVHNLHGLPGVISGIGSVIAAGVATKELYGDGLHKIFAEGKTRGQLAGLQIAGLVLSVAMALVCGVITGFVLKLPIWDQPKGDQLFDDETFWMIEGGMPEVEHQVPVNEANNNEAPKPAEGKQEVTQFNADITT